MSSLYVLKEGEKWGPYSEEELAGHVEAGSFSATDMVWAEGFEDWMPLSSLINIEAGEAVPETYFDEGGVQVTREAVVLEENEIPLIKITKATAQIEQVRRFKPLAGAVVVGVIVIGLALLEIPRETMTAWMIWGAVLLGLAIWWLRLLIVGLRAPASLIVIDLVDGSERILQVPQDVAANFETAVRRALADFRAGLTR